MNFLTLARLGALVGLFEAIGIGRYDIVMDDPRPERLVLAAAWGLAVIAVNVLAFGLMGKLCRGRWWLVAGIYLAMVCGARLMLWDRFSYWGLAPAPFALGAAALAGRWPRFAGLAAVLLAMPGLWGRVPVYTTSDENELRFHVPAAIITLLAGAILVRPGRRAATAAATAAATVGLAVLAAVGLHHPTAKAASAGKPNVLFILVDTLRRSAVTPYGDEADLPGEEPAGDFYDTEGGVDTPSTRRLAAEGMVMNNAITVIPKTTQSVAAFFTGKYPVNNGVRILHDRLRGREKTLAETFQDAGYRTGAVVHNGWVMRGRGFEQGFEQFWSFFEIERAWGALRLTGIVMALDAFTVRRIRDFDGNVDSEVSTDRVLSWLDESRGDGRPFFLYVHYFDPHWPYRPPGKDGECTVNDIASSKWSRGRMIFNNPLPRAENDKAVQLYEYEVDHVTDEVGRILDWLDDAGIADDTIVVFTADHGHHLGDHQYWYHHGEFLYEPGVQIPMILRWPGHIEAGSTEYNQFRSVDLMPTLLGLAGVTPPEKIDGKPLDTLRSEGSPPAFLETDISYFKSNKRRYVKGPEGKVRGVRDGQWKLHYTPRKGPGEWELYDLRSDPKELHDLVAAGEAPEEVISKLLPVLSSHIPDAEKAGLEKIGNRFDRLPTAAEAASTGADDREDDPNAGMNANDQRMLEALGYIED